MRGLKIISQFSEDGDSLGSWERAKKAGERGKKGGTLSVVGSERKMAGERGKKWGDCLGSWERLKKAGKRGKKGGDCLSSWGRAKEAGANLKNQHAINLF